MADSMSSRTAPLIFVSAIMCVYVATKKTTLNESQFFSPEGLRFMSSLSCWPTSVTLHFLFMVALTSIPVCVAKRAAEDLDLMRRCFRLNFGLK